MDTIVAVATPPGRSAIGVVRLSGPQALMIIRSLTCDPKFQPEPNQVVLKEVRQSGSDEVLDLALITFFQAPHSFTGEDMAEISCHGSPVILRQLLDLVQRLDARLAGPGEFTLRACRNGKMNLSQAEAIRDLINARTKAAAQQATRQLKGELARTLQTCKQELISVIVSLESALEFVEDDLPQIQRQAILDHLQNSLRTIKRLSDTYRTGHLLREGIKVALVGRPNVGKSSVFNMLVQFDRAIVTDLPGTTRDSITESISLGGIPVSLTDTAGMHEAGDRIEAIGVERTHQAIADADLLVIVVDGSTQFSPEDNLVLTQAEELRYVVAINKCDLPKVQGVENQIRKGAQVVHVSALTGEGLEDLTAVILEPFGNADSEEVGLLITDSRHHDLLLRAQRSLEDGIELYGQNASEEIILVGLHSALKFLGEITGETTTDDILGEIFSTFCIGK